MPLQYLKLRELEIRRHCGVRRLCDRMHFRAGTLSPGLNLVYGPNASGKTTTARAVAALLWPDSEASADSGISSLWAVGDGEAVISIAGGAQSVSVDGDLGKSLPVPLLAKTYRLALQDLLAADDGDLAGMIRNEMFGGLDLDGAAVALGAGSMPEGRMTVARGLRAASERVRRVSACQRELLVRSSELATLECRLSRARGATERSAALAETLEIGRKRSELAELDRELADFKQRGVPAGLRPDHPERLEEILNERKNKLDQVGQKHQAIESATQAIEATGFDEGGPPDTKLLAEADERIVRLMALESAIGQIRGDLSGSEAKAVACREFAGGRVEPDGDHSLSLDSLRRARPLFERWRAAGARRDGIAAALRVAGDGLPNGEGKALAVQAVDCLLDWLTAARDSGGARGRDRMAALAAVSTAAVFALLASFGSPWWALGLVLSFAVFLLPWFWAPSGVADALREKCREKYEGLAGVPEVSDWSHGEVRKALRETQALVARERDLELRRLRAASLARDLEDSEAMVAEARTAVFEALAGAGVQLDDVLPGDWEVVAEAVARWRREEAECDRLRAVLGDLVSRYEKEIQLCTDLFRAWGEPEISDSAGGRAVCNDLRERAGGWREADRELRQLKADIESLERDCTILAGRASALVKEVFPESECNPESELVRMKTLVAGSADYRDCMERRRHLAREIANRETAMRTLPGWEEEWARFEEHEIASRLGAERELAEDYERLHEEVVSLRNEVSRASDGHDLEEALAERTSARERLESVAREAADNATARAVVEFIRASVGESASSVLSRARSIFARVTSNCYELEIGADSPPQLAAFDCVAGERKALAELSSATKIQLLLSVRVAFLEEQEEGLYAPPLLLDEVLANSDEDRARAVMATVIEIVRLGRQVFYFTAQTDELAKWQSVLDSRDRELPRQIVYLPLGSMEPDRPDATLTELLDQSPTLPDDMDYDEYGTAIGVGAFPLFGGREGAIHVFYLLDSTERLYRLLELGCRTWGQLDVLRRRADMDVLAELGVAGDPSFVTALDARRAVLTKLRELYAIGRGRPVTRDIVLDPDSPVSNLKHADRVADLADQLEGDGAALIAALDDHRVKGFQQRKTRELEDWLNDRGFLDERPPIAREELVARVMGECASTISRSGLSAAQALRTLRRAVGRHRTYSG